MKLSALIGLIGGLVLASSPARAADATFKGIVENFGTSEAHFRLEGPITDSDVDAIKAALATAGINHEQDVWRRIVVELDSPGGSYQAGLDLALLFRRMGLATNVASGDRCFSACALAFLGGTDLPKDPAPPTDDGPIPNQPPDRRLEPGAALGFHAPYLDIGESSYTAQNVSDAYTAAVLAIARFIAIADHLFISTAELPTLLKPTRDDLYMVDNVDAVRFLGIDYIDPSQRIIDDPKKYTQSMIVNACINRYYHLQRRSSFVGFATAASVIDEFIEGSKLLENGEADLAFGTRRVKQGTLSTWLAFTPIAKTYDDKNFVWCLFSPGSNSAFYKSAGTVSELFDELEVKDDLWEFSQSPTTMKIGNEGSDLSTWMPELEMVPPNTKLTDIARQITRYTATEDVISAR